MMREISENIKYKAIIKSSKPLVKVTNDFKALLTFTGDYFYCISNKELYPNEWNTYFKLPLFLFNSWPAVYSISLNEPELTNEGLNYFIQSSEDLVYRLDCDENYFEYRIRYFQPRIGEPRLVFRVVTSAGGIETDFVDEHTMKLKQITRNYSRTYEWGEEEILYKYKHSLSEDVPLFEGVSIKFDYDWNPKINLETLNLFFDEYFGGEQWLTLDTTEYEEERPNSVVNRIRITKDPRSYPIIDDTSFSYGSGDFRITNTVNSEGNLEFKFYMVNRNRQETNFTENGLIIRRSFDTDELEYIYGVDEGRTNFIEK